MELFQELVFTISFSLIVYLLIAKLFAATSSCDNGNSTVSVRVCDSEKEGKTVCVEDPIKGSEEVDVGCVVDDLGSGVVVKEVESVGGVGACEVFDEMPERTEVNDVGVEYGESDEGFDDDWQGIETTELEKRFGAAVAFMDSKSGVDRVNLIDNQVKVELYGLHKVAIEGSCFEPQPMALKVSARANWNSWKRLENLGREDAMEQYIALLSQHVPDWMGRHASDKQ